MSFLIVLAALCLLMFVAYRGYSVILFAPVAALGAVLLTDASLVAPMFTGLFMEKMVGFLKLYFPVFLLGAVFGKLIEISGFSKSIVAATIRVVGAQRAMLSIVLVCALLTYGGVSLFVVVFAVYPFAAELFRQSDIPKRLIPGTIALGAFTFTMDALPGTPQIQNIIPTAFFGTTAWAAPVLGTLGAVFILVLGMSYLEWRRRAAARAGEGYGGELRNEPEPFRGDRLAHPLLAILPLLVVGVANFAFTRWIPQWYGSSASFVPAVIGNPAPVVQEVSKVAAIWAVQAALLCGIACVIAFAWRPVLASFAEGTRSAIGGALLASMNTASEYGFGAVIAALPGFLLVAHGLGAIPNPLVNEAVSVTALAGITGSASGGMSIALAAMADSFIANAQAAGIPMEVLHRVAAMASGGMDTLPHNGAVITLLAVTGLSHRQSYKDVFAITLVKTLAVFVVIAAYYLTGWV
ncbi:MULTISPECIES: GntP family permease [Pseudoxanthomonas]|uniref:H+/gluconate symporter-like permease n=1 Tax=Pseudoxanthomonas winnipegensis TaxID=2480810 RepID=A0AAW8GAD4_9GAMM|nr:MULTISPECIES: GntP family permease [Pseudoxanthomonas]MDQ1119376.1 H+/gluconate symporter-like permease [Pseudoxanthomonas winnipegensis]MDQ1132568.1 H+/gluconate symporter-like permease [Pseudoxanthomonas winnipegensis]MDR6137422.1 H+/gluconate symporter-like permease [Pseudoxanthomonas sp. SORGH_AS_0997]